MEPYIGEIRLMGCSFAPKGWAFCQGQLLPINQYQALYSVLGTFYGGNGTTNFGLPDLRGRVPIGYGQGNGLSSYPIGARGGTEGVSLTTQQMGAHGHTITGTLQSGTAANSKNPVQTNYPANSSASQYATGGTAVTMNGGVVAGQTDVAGSGQAHENRQPLLALNFCIALVGIFPSRQ